MDRKSFGMNPREATQVVEPHDVVGVRMGDEDRVEGGDAGPQALAAKDGPGIDD